MANNLQTTSSLTPAEIDPFDAFGNEFGGQTHIHGHLLRFTKHGDYKYGQDQEEMDEGTRMLAYLPGLMKGMVKWEDQRPVKHLIGLVAEGFQPPLREELGDHDKSKWRELSGQQIDPWQFTAYLPMLDDQGELYTFVTSSKGGLGTLSELSKSFARRRKMHPNDIPIVKLLRRSYQHAEFGETFAPVFRVDGWSKIPADFDELKSALTNGGAVDAIEDKATEVFVSKTTRAKPKEKVQERPARKAASGKKGVRF